MSEIKIQDSLNNLGKALQRLKEARRNSCKECLKKAYEVRWIENETVWLQMLPDRNETSHE